MKKLYSILSRLRLKDIFNIASTNITILYNVQIISKECEVN